MSAKVPNGGSIHFLIKLHSVQRAPAVRVCPRTLYRATAQVICAQIPAEPQIRAITGLFIFQQQSPYPLGGERSADRGLSVLCPQ